MIDIFISYSNKDRELAASLAAALEAKGFSTWWDFNLVGGANYRKEILQQLQAARAVIVIWTENSVTSEFVLDEADHAAAEKKFIPVRDQKLEIRNIPLGFRGAQTYPLTEIERIAAALKAMGVEPGGEGNSVAQRVAKQEPARALPWRAVAASILTAGFLGAVVYGFLPGKRANADEDSVWHHARTTWTREAMRDYLNHYPEGFYHRKAKALIESDMGILCARFRWRVSHPLLCHEVATMAVRH
ncbi:MAG: toll/interleukin-1 receptor domain-containing protein [Rhodomicrobium sp.]